MAAAAQSLGTSGVSSNTISQTPPGVVAVAGAGALPGSYAITVSLGTLSAANYVFLLKSGTLTVIRQGTTSHGHP